MALWEVADRLWRAASDTLKRSAPNSLPPPPPPHCLCSPPPRLLRDLSDVNLKPTLYIPACLTTTTFLSVSLLLPLSSFLHCLGCAEEVEDDEDAAALALMASYSRWRALALALFCSATCRYSSTIALHFSASAIVLACPHAPALAPVSRPA
eukprot:2555938-Rhodomonas_salina.2